MTRIMIIGGVAGGMSAATRLRRLMEDAHIIVVDKGPYVSFANCGLPFHLSGEISSRDKLLVQSAEGLTNRFGLDVRPETEALAIDTKSKQVTLKHDGKVYQESYDQLILSPGAKPFVPKMEGLAQAKNVCTLRNIPDLDRIMAALADKDQGMATVIGAGFIGLEMAEALTKRGFQVTLVEKAPHVLPPLDQEMASFIQEELRRNGVKVVTGQSAKAFEDQGKWIILEDGSRLQSDLTILSVGVEPETTLAKEAGLELGLRGGIVVDHNYQTSHKDIYAVGDAIIVKQELTGQDALISLASPANRQGRQVADVIAGLARKNRGSMGTAIVRVFDLAAASTGLSERLAKQHFEDVAVVHVRGNDHASYFPGASPITLKLIFNSKTGALYGAQAVGAKGIDKRIDVLATAIKAGLTVADLPELELTYAPPFGSAKDPVNMVGYAAMNVMEGLSRSIQWYQLQEELASGKVLLDVRTAQEVAQAPLEGALSIPLDDLRQRMGELDQSKSYIVSCYSGLRSYLAERLLRQAGFDVMNLDGAYALYRSVYPERFN
ncbi:FAD-dependent oxidoreductase [Streptococcus ictaluri]